ncbi:unnamed protein product [Cuscuta campestris]|uniref:Uncharacterized protein n=1 Tax=Cuscuta campestris TaxID=132261 RepID=A0A484N4W3_9ASTE|nr:unnamed protein product [Cuscuta campestris]
MSLTLLQSYSSAEEDDGEVDEKSPDYDRSEEEDGGVDDAVSLNRYKPLVDPNPTPSSSLPSALAAFSEVSGPPEFLNNSVDETAANEAGNQRWRHGRRKNSRDKKDLPSGVVVEAKAHLVGIHERVRSDVEGIIPKKPNGQRNLSSASAQGGNSSVRNPNAELASALLRDTNTEADKKKGSTIKDKEKVKRMRGQSSHASWKSETEMILRQHFD